MFMHGGRIEVDSPEDLSVNFDTSAILDDYHGQSLNFGKKAVTLARLKNLPEFRVQSGTMSVVSALDSDRG